MIHKSGYFITVEGVDGSGKTGVVVPALCEFLNQHLIKPVVTREPGGTPFAEAIRTLFKSDVCNDVDHTALALLVSAARRDHVTRVIMPALANGSVVVSDRYIATTVMYQYNAKDLSRIIETGCAGLLPDLVILLDIPYDVYCARLAERVALDASEEAHNHLDIMDAELFNRRRAALIQFHNLYPVHSVLVDATASKEDVVKIVNQHVQRAMGFT